MRYDERWEEKWMRDDEINTSIRGIVFLIYMWDNYVLNLENIYVREIIFCSIMYKNNHPKFANIFPENSIDLLQLLTNIRPCRLSFLHHQASI